MTTIVVDRPVEAPTVPERSTRDILLHAARIVEEHGWCQFALQDDEGRVCALGALMVAGTGNALSFGPIPMGAWRALTDLIGIEWGDIAVWNNAPERTAGDVVAALRRAAAES